MSDNKSVADHFSTLPAVPEIDFSLFGEVEVENLPRAQAFGGQFLARNWATIPHVTHHDEADITALEAFRKSLVTPEGRAKVSPPILLIKAIVAALKEFPKFNSSLDSTGKKIVVKKYYNIGMAVDTPNGLLVPVIKDADKKDIFDLADELKDLAETARDKGLPISKMEGGSFTLSSIGGLGGLAFTPIINAPEVAILGATKAYWKPDRGENDEIVW
ncbi:MAG: 2-oxo acid dehydrogenase subunit E2, partial [bacterium]